MSAASHSIHTHSVDWAPVVAAATANSLIARPRRREEDKFVPIPGAVHLPTARRLKMRERVLRSCVCRRRISAYKLFNFSFDSFGIM